MRGSGRAVVTVDPKTWNSGASLVEMIPLPLPLALLARVLRWWLVHPMLLSVVLFGVYVAVETNAVTGLCSGLGLWVVIVLVRVGWAGRSCSYALGHPNLIVRTLFHLYLVRKRWTEASEAASCTRRTDGRSPKLRKVRITPGNVSATVKLGAVGRTSREFLASSDTYAAVMGADAVSVDILHPGVARVTFSWGDPTNRVLHLSDLKPAPDGYTSFGLNPDGGPVMLGLDTSVLCIGESGSGKSNIVWAYLAGLEEAGIPFRLRVIDPAGGVELSKLEYAPFTKYYTDKARDAEKLILQARDSMQARLHDMKRRGDRTHIPTPEEPLDITIVDELLLLGDQIKQGASGALGELLSVGRKAKYRVFALSQLSQVDALGRIRDLFPQRIALATKSREMTEAALGPSAEAMGAACSKIPRQTPGVGYMYKDGVRGYQRFRSVLVTDEEADLIAQGKTPREITEQAHAAQQQQKELANRRTAVYRVYSDNGTLLYVGITVNPNVRFSEHAAEKPWWTAVDMSKTRIEWYRNRVGAKKAETKAIQAERPIYNIDEATLIEEAS